MLSCQAAVASRGDARRILVKASRAPNGSNYRGHSARLGRLPNAEPQDEKRHERQDGQRAQHCSGGSNKSSPRRNRPATSASSSPTPTPMLKPRSTRPSDTHRCCCSSPDRTSSQPVASTALGAASTRGETSSNEDASCHASSSSKGPMRRRSRQRAKIICLVG